MLEKCWNCGDGCEVCEDTGLLESDRDFTVAEMWAFWKRAEVKGMTEEQFMQKCEALLQQAELQSGA